MSVDDGVPSTPIVNLGDIFPDLFVCGNSVIKIVEWIDDQSKVKGDMARMEIARYRQKS